MNTMCYTLHWERSYYVLRSVSMLRNHLVCASLSWLKLYYV